jgi:rhodanese-related sulfurtransferase
MNQMTELNKYMSSYQPESGRCSGISLREAQIACTLGAVMLDVRETYNTDYKQFDVPESLLMPLSLENELSDSLPRDRWIIIADVSGNMSVDFCNRLIQKGYQQVCVLSGGFVEWERLGLPIITDIHQAFSGSCVCQLKQRNLNQK